MMRDQMGGNETPFLRCFTKPCHAGGDCGGAVFTLQNPLEKQGCEGGGLELLGATIKI